jgi:hypothetical protein
MKPCNPNGVLLVIIVLLVFSLASFGLWRKALDRIRKLEEHLRELAKRDGGPK